MRKTTENNDINDYVCGFVGFHILCSCNDVCFVLENFCLGQTNDQLQGIRPCVGVDFSSVIIVTLKFVKGTLGLEK